MKRIKQELTFQECCKKRWLMCWVFQELFKVRNKIEKNEKHSENISLDAFLIQKIGGNVNE